MSIPAVHLSYLGLCLALTLYFGRDLSRKNRLFLLEVFRGNRELATSVLRPIMGGFYLVTLADIVSSAAPMEGFANFWQDLQFESGKFGFFLFVLGAMHFVSVFLLSRMTQNARRNGNHGESILA
jgi:hypothetical protein